MYNRAPSVARLMRDLPISEDQARTIRGLIKGTIDPESIEGTADWVRQCHHRPSDDELLMDAIDETLETFGVEAIWNDARSCTRPEYVYCNTGDSYAATIMQKRGTWGWGAPFIGSWGDIVERNPRLR